MHSAPGAGAAGLFRAALACDKSRSNTKEVLVIAVTETLKAKAGKEQELASAVQALARHSNTPYFKAGIGEMMALVGHREYCLGFRLATEKRR
jgi:hypothetical protein